MQILSCVFLMVSLFRFPAECFAAALEALRIWGLSVVPSLFPYMVLCRTLAAQFAQSRVSPMLAASVLGLLGGSPSGAAVLTRYPLNKRSLFSLCALTGTISPMFLLNTANLWAQDSLFCKRLLASHIVGACMAAGALHYPLRHSCECAEHRISSSHDAHPIAQSISSILNVGGCIVFFSVAAKAITQNLPHAQAAASAVIHSLLEISGGLHSLLALSFHRTPFGASLCAALCAFSGLSILTQNHLMLKSCGVSMPYLILAALLRALFSAAAMYLLCAFNLS